MNHFTRLAVAKVGINSRWWGHQSEQEAGVGVFTNRRKPGLLTRYLPIKIAGILFLMLLEANVFSQSSSAIKFSYSTQRINDSEVVLSIKGAIPAGVKLFALQKSAGDIMYSSIHFDSSVSSRLKGSVFSKEKIQTKKDPALEGTVHFFINSVQWQQKLRSSQKDSFLLKGNVSYMYQKGSDYPSKKDEFEIFVLPTAHSSVIQFSYSTQRINDTEVVLSIKGAIPAGVKLFALQKSPDDIMYSSIHFDSSVSSRLKGSAFSKEKIQTKKDPALESTVRFFTDSVQWKQKIKASVTDSFLVKGAVNYLYQEGSDYPSKKDEFQVFVLPTHAAESRNSEDAQLTQASNGGTVATKSLWWIFLTAFAGGLLALITPCVYSMIPVTVSFFTKRSKNKAEGIRNAFTYSLSIIVIFTLLGFLITVIFGPAALNNLATNWIANIIFFLIFLIFGISFLGAFEIALPSSWGNRADSKASSGSFMGIFFMALTLVVVSFSCTGPIIGNLLVMAARGSYWGPLIGMFGFSLALALPFALFAFFPGKLNVLGKAGGWLNAVKVTLGFLELALALKFLSNADLSQGWRILDREVFISLWIVIFILLGFYLLGKLKFHHDDQLPKNDFDIPYISIPRLFFAIASLSFAVYMFPGLWGAPLKGISAFVPPMGTQDFTSSSSKDASFQEKNRSSAELPQPVKYYDRMKMYEPDVVTKYGMTTYFDYDEALAVARKLHKPLMLDFTGINCVNCRKMEGSVWSDPEVMKRLKDNFVIVSLYVDVHTIDLQPSEQYFSKALDKKVTTLGDKNADLQISKYNANTQPYYFFLNANENRLEPEGYGYDAEVQKFKNMLDDVVTKYKHGK
jgi:thiol:disulfide interchange protein